MNYYQYKNVWRRRPFWQLKIYSCLNMTAIYWVTGLLTSNWIKAGTNDSKGFHHQSNPARGTQTLLPSAETGMLSNFHTVKHFIAYKSVISPVQLISMLQFLASALSPIQLRPWLAGDGFVHDLILVFSPPPQLTEHVDQLLHDVQPPFTGWPGVVYFVIVAELNVQSR